MEQELIIIGKNYESRGRATEAIWKAVYVLGFEILKEEEDLLLFRKKGFFGAGERQLRFTLSDEIINLEASPRDFEQVKRKLK